MLSGPTAVASSARPVRTESGADSFQGSPAVCQTAMRNLREPWEADTNAATVEPSVSSRMTEVLDPRRVPSQDGAAGSSTRPATSAKRPTMPPCAHAAATSGAPPGWIVTAFSFVTLQRGVTLRSRAAVTSVVHEDMPTPDDSTRARPATATDDGEAAAS